MPCPALLCSVCPPGRGHGDHLFPGINPLEGSIKLFSFLCVIVSSVASQALAGRPVPASTSCKVEPVGSGCAEDPSPAGLMPDPCPRACLAAASTSPCPRLFLIPVPGRRGPNLPRDAFAWVTQLRLTPGVGVGWEDSALGVRVARRTQAQTVLSWQQHFFLRRRPVRGRKRLESAAPVSWAGPAPQFQFHLLSLKAQQLASGFSQAGLPLEVSVEGEAGLLPPLGQIRFLAGSLPVPPSSSRMSLGQREVSAPDWVGWSG